MQNKAFFDANTYAGHYMDKGKHAEKLVMDWLRSRPDVRAVHDYRDHRLMQKYDVDIGVDLIDGRTILAEIKHDEHLGKSDNVLFETLRLNLNAPPERAAVLGWSARTPAQRLYWYAPAVNSIYECAPYEMRRALQAYLSKCKANNVQPKVVWINTDPGVTTQNILIPMRFCDSLFQVYLLSHTNGHSPVGEIPF